MCNIDLNSLSLSELIKIQKELPNAILKAKKKLQKEIEILASENGVTLEELLQPHQNNANIAEEKEAKVKKAPKAIKTKQKVPAKYRNTKKPYQTWTGRGRRPKWVEEHIARHDTLDLVRITKEDA